MSLFRTGVKRVVRAGLHQGGGLTAILWNSRKRFRILMYHRFSSALYPGGQEALGKQCAYLKRCYHVVPLAEIAESLRSGKPLPPKALAITIDDGYRDFLQDAVPVFRAWQIPATVFLMTDFLDGKAWPWWDQVAYAAQRAPAGRIRLSLAAGETAREFSIQTEQDRAQVSAAICAKLVKVPNQKRLEFLRTLPELFRVEIPRNAVPESGALTWDEVRSLARSGVEFGAHTKTHPVLPNLEDEDEIYEEIAGSKLRIERELGRAPLHFCYPNGDFDDRARRAVERCGFETAVTTEPGLNRKSENRYLLKRIAAEPDLPDQYFREQVAGLHAN